MDNGGWQGPRTLPAAAAWRSASMTGLSCPSCRRRMESLLLESHSHEPVEVDLCFHCHGIWFDQRESLKLSPGGVLALFERLHAHKDEPHSALKPSKACPRCHRRLVRGMDRTISGSYVVYRCPQHHGRFGTFSSFMVEKGFVRQLTMAEIRSLAARVRTIHCGNCGAPVDLRKDHACPYCRSAFSLLDPKAVEAAMARYQRSDQARQLATSALIPTDGTPGTRSRDANARGTTRAAAGRRAGGNQVGQAIGGAGLGGSPLATGAGPMADGSLMGSPPAEAPSGRRPGQQEIHEMTDAVQQARADLLIAQARIDSLREQHRRDQQLERLRSGSMYATHFGDELWAAGLSLIWRMIRGLFR